MKKNSDIIMLNYLMVIFFIRFILSIIGLAIVAFGVYRTVFQNQSFEEYIIMLIIVLSILAIEKFIDLKTGIYKMKGIKVERFGGINIESTIGEGVVPVELKSINPYGDSMFEVHMLLNFPENPTIYIYKTKDKKIISEYSYVAKNIFEFVIRVKQDELLNFKFDNAGIIKKLLVLEIYSPYELKRSRKRFL